MEEEGEDLVAAGLAFGDAFFQGVKRLRVFPIEFGGELVAVFDALLAVDDGHVAIDGVDGDLQIAGDLGNGPAVFHADEDGLALGGGAGTAAKAAHTLGVRGFWRVEVFGAPGSAGASPSQ